MHEDRITTAVRDPKFLARFWAKVDRSGECWVWTKDRGNYRGIKTYGMARLPGTKTWCKRVGAHRVAWTEANGRIPDETCVLHKCDNYVCVRPSHLFLGTIADNNADKARKGRAPRLCGETNGFHKLTLADVQQVRAMNAAGVATRDIAKHFGVDKSTIRGKLAGHRAVLAKNQYG
jgi:hypothetical protein